LVGRQYSPKGPVPEEVAVLEEVAALEVAVVRGVVPAEVDPVAALEVDQVAGPAGTLAGGRVAVPVDREEALELGVVRDPVPALAWDRDPVDPVVPVGALAGGRPGGPAGVMPGGGPPIGVITPTPIMLHRL